jgi:hypothetical protein
MRISVDTAIWGLVVGSLLPIVVALVTKSSAPKSVKAGVLLVLSAAIAVGQDIVAAGSFEVKETILKFAALVLVAVGVHLGVTKPLGVTGSNGIAATEGGIG